VLDLRPVGAKPLRWSGVKRIKNDALRRLLRQ
jgi:hypothetical protein